MHTHTHTQGRDRVEAHRGAQPLPGLMASWGCHGSADGVSTGHRGLKHMVTWRPVAPTSQTWLCQEHSVSHGAGSEQDGGVQVGAWPGRRSWSSACQTAWDRVVTCLGPVNTQPKGLLSHAYEIGGSTEVLAPITLGHIGQAEACVGLHTLTDPGLRGQETRLRCALGSPAGHRVAMWAQGPEQTPPQGWHSRNGGGGQGYARQEGFLEEVMEAPPSSGPWLLRMCLRPAPPTSAQSMALQGWPSACLPQGPGRAWLCSGVC